MGTFVASPSRNQFMTPSESYLQVSLIFAILPSEDIATSLEKLMAPFSRHLWQGTGLCVVFAAIIISLTKQLSRRQRHFIIGGRLNTTPILNMWSSFLGGGIANPQFAKARYFSTFARSLLMIWIIGCLVLRNSYTGALYDFLQRETMESPFDTVAKINQSDCKLVVENSAALLLESFSFSKER